MCICGSGVRDCRCPGENRVNKQETSTMTPEIIIQMIVTASAVIQIVHNICELITHMNKKR